MERVAIPVEIGRKLKEIRKGMGKAWPGRIYLLRRMILL